MVSQWTSFCPADGPSLRYHGCHQVLYNLARCTAAPEDGRHESTAKVAWRGRTRRRPSNSSSSRSWLPAPRSPAGAFHVRLELNCASFLLRFWKRINYCFLRNVLGLCKTFLSILTTQGLYDFYGEMSTHLLHFLSSLFSSSNPTNKEIYNKLSLTQRHKTLYFIIRFQFVRNGRHYFRWPRGT